MMPFDFKSSNMISLHVISCHCMRHITANDMYDEGYNEGRQRTSKLWFCQSISVAVHCNFILQKKSISKWYPRYVKLIRYSLFRSLPFLGREKNRIWGNYGILGKFVQIGIWYLVHLDHFIIMGFQQSQQIDGLFIIRFYWFRAQNANFVRKTQRLWIAWYFRGEEKHFTGTSFCRWWKIYRRNTFIVWGISIINE